MTSLAHLNSYFEDLPVELHRIILSLLPDFSSLRCVVLASRSAQAAYAVSSQFIQFAVLRTLLSSSPQLASELRWLFEASFVRRSNRDWHDSMDDFLPHHDVDVEEQHKPDPPEIVTAEGLRFHMVVEYFTTAFLKATRHPRPQRSPRLSRGNVDNFPLQHAEGIRIQRALYRFQRICQMYPRITQPSQRGPTMFGEHPLGDFIRRLPSWELEELHCIYRFLISSLSFLDEPPYSFFIRDECLSKGLTAWRYKEHVVSLGLIFLWKLMVAPLETRMSLLKRYCGSDSHSLSDVLPLGGTNTGIGVHASSRSLTIQSLFGPSAGWVLFHPPSAKDRGRAPMDELRDWGYCFWERERLEAWGVCRAEEEPTGRSSWIQRIRGTGEALQLWRYI